MVDDEEWTVQLGEAFGQQIPLYATMVEERVSAIFLFYFRYDCYRIITAHGGLGL